MDLDHAERDRVESERDRRRDAECERAALEKKERESADAVEVDKILTHIEALDLPHPSFPLLREYVRNSHRPVHAARYLNERFLAGDTQTIVSDWIFIVEAVTRHGSPPPTLDAKTQDDIRSRDGNRCCISGNTGTRRDPLTVLPILPLPTAWATAEIRVRNMLESFFSSEDLETWLFSAEYPELCGPHESHWLVQKSAAETFAKGYVKLEKLGESGLEFCVCPVEIGPNQLLAPASFPLLGDHSRLGVAKVDPVIIDTQARLATSIRYVEIAQRIAPQLVPEQYRPQTPAVKPNKPLIVRVFRGGLFPIFGILRPTINIVAQAFIETWRFLPSGVRAFGYDMLRKLGELLYGVPDPSRSVRRLPFGLFLKYRGDAPMHTNEFNALRRVYYETSIPVPKPIGLVAKDYNSYLLTTRLPGVPLNLCQEVFSDAEYDAITAQLQDYLTQVRNLPKTVNPEMAICNTLGDSCRDFRIQGSSPVGPFPDEAAFSKLMRFSDDPARRGHKIVFTHADLNARNILVDLVPLPDGTTGWRITGIVDWETAGYYPEYWDYTKALFEGFRWEPRFLKMVHQVFAAFGDYSKELDVERRAWGSGDAV
ncbi:hypothetical protein B0J18DRAFT_432607 [Chaetomium sp. MPI-SDFR-AT-0129]|nr:hypothetical protein B0J18DRAFT_432607 [Chaetomium sp. MPI-SDFR-AT-0129]